MKKSTKIITVVTIVLTAILVATAIFFAIKQNRNENDPGQTTPPITDIDVPDIDDKNPNDTQIPDIPTGENDKGNEDKEPGDSDDIVIDVGRDTEDSQKRDEPSIDGDVVIILGVKGDDE